jgi:hypothetical protein
MYIKMNIFQNIFNTVIGVKWKTKDNMKAKIDIPLFFQHNNMELIYDRLRVAKLKASFALDKNA